MPGSSRARAKASYQPKLSPIKHPDRVGLAIRDQVLFNYTLYNLFLNLITEIKN